MTPQSRDPRTSPQPGDQLKRRGEIRKVLLLRVDSIGLVRGIIQTAIRLRSNGSVAGSSRRELSLIMWRKWAASAEVITRGDKS